MQTPIKVIISGVSGRIGRRLLKLVLANREFELVAGLVSPNSQYLGQDLGTLADLDNTGLVAIDSLVDVRADVVVDFSQPEGFDELVDYCVLQQTALVSGTTGLNQQSFDRLSQAAKYIPVMWTSNFSLNIQVLKNLLQVIKQVNPTGQFSITETHHIHKKDMPSGTAISLAQAIESQSSMIKTTDNTFQLGAVEIIAERQGEVPGTHEVTCQLDDETLSFKHQAHDPAIFAQGALNVAQWIHGQPSGFYDLNAMLMA